jgi:galactoside 2-L-fucosyltransferase 1/2
MFYFIFSWTTLYEDNAYKMETIFLELPLKNLRISAFLQVYEYFESVVEEVLKEFVFKDSVLEEASRILTRLPIKPNVTLIGVHARRGDFLSKRNIENGYIVPEKSYFFNAFNFMKRKYPKNRIRFLVASDDLKWCRKNLKTPGVSILPRASPGVHMAILAKSSHVIMSSGTYGWWAGFMAGGDVVYFKGIFPKGSYFGDKFNATIYYPPWWYPIDN